MIKASKLLLAAATAAAVAISAAGVSAAEKENGFTSMVESVGSSIKSGFNKVTESVSPKPKKNSITTSDATSLLVKAKPSAKLYVAVAQTYVSGDNLQEAADMYKKALDIEPGNVDALAGLAQLKDRQGAYGEAIILYEKAAKAHPNDAIVFNGMGLCHATHDNFKAALPALERAVQLAPRELKYRNNIAMVLVEMGRYGDAFAHFKTQYDDPVAHYNLAYLLQKRGDKQMALQHFAAAVQKNPQFEEARTWLNHLAGEQSPQQTTSQYQPVQQPAYQPARQPMRQMAQSPVQIGARSPAPAAQMAARNIGPASGPQANASRTWTPQYRPPAVADGPSQPEIARNAMQRTWSTSPDWIPFAQRPTVPQRRQLKKQRTSEQSRQLAQRQLEALGPPAPPLPTADQNDRLAGTTVVGGDDPASTTAPQRLPPVEQSFQSAPLAPMPPMPSAKLAVKPEAVDKSAVTSQVAPLPGPIVPTAPPDAGTTRAAVVYPLPPVNEYRQ